MNDLLVKCAVEGCPNLVAGQRYCSRCQEEIDGTPYPIANLLLGETFLHYVTRVWDRLTR